MQSSKTRRMFSAMISLIAASLGTVVVADPAVAAQHQNAYIYVNWNWSGSGYWNVDQNIVIKRKATATYWAQVWRWTDASFGGYTGLQTNGSRGDGSTGDTAIFSLWNANAANGPLCGQFSGEGNGYSCRLAYPISLNVLYRLRIWRLNADTGGQWWGAWVKNNSTGTDTYIGSIRVGATHGLMTSVRNFSEYFGTAVPCNQVPRSVADFTQPAANSQGGGGYQYGSTYASYNRGACTGGNVAVVSYGWTNAARVTLGG